MKEILPLPPELGGDLWFHRYQNRAYPMHHHAELEFNLVTRGAGTYLMADRKYELTRHALLWLFPEQEHVLVHQSPDFEMWVAVFKPEVLRRTCTTAANRTLLEPNPPGSYCRWLPMERTAKLHDLLQGVFGEKKNLDRFNAGLAYGLLVTWDEYQQAINTPVGSDVHPAVEKAARLIQEDPAIESLAAIAEQAGLSPARLSRLFHQQTGVNLVDFRNRKRLDQFLALYGGGQRKTMLQAALEAGFGSYPQFHRVFKQVMGHGPQEHRRRTR